MPMVEISVNVEVFCRTCRAGLCMQTRLGHDKNGNPFFVVDPCKNCIQKAREEGYKEAKSEK